MAIASKLLIEGGYLMIMDVFDHSYGNIMQMENFVFQNRLQLALEVFNDQFFQEEKVAMLWKKVGPTYDRIAEMQMMEGSEHIAIARQLSWHPDVPERKDIVTNDVG